MISVEEALHLMQELRLDLGAEEVPLDEVPGRILAENVCADRNFPPFHRATKDGIAVKYKAVAQGVRQFEIEGVQAAGEAQKELQNPFACLEVMTGAVVPGGADTVIMYEHVEIKNGVAILGAEQVREQQNIHFAGEDARQGDVLLHAPVKLALRHISTLASVGKALVKVAKLPKVAVISTGDELVDVHETPEQHQIRKSNVYALRSLLQEDGISGDLFHVKDEKESINQVLERLLEEYDVLILSGGVSKGKFDYIPECLQGLGVEKVFHGVKQRPGKPFWFGKKDDKRIFALPGNPISTYVCYLLYFRTWLGHTVGWPLPGIAVAVEPAGALKELSYHRLVHAGWDSIQQKLRVNYIDNSGSGDLVSLNQANGLLSLPPLAAPQAMAQFTPFSTRFYEYVS